MTEEQRRMESLWRRIYGRVSMEDSKGHLFGLISDLESFGASMVNIKTSHLDKHGNPGPDFGHHLFLLFLQISNSRVGGLLLGINPTPVEV